MLLLEHVFQPLGYTVNGEIEWDGADDLQDRGSFYVKDNVLGVIDTVIFTPGPSWAPSHFADELLQQAISDLLASETNAGCSADLTVVSAYAVNRIRQILPKIATVLA